MSAPTRSGLISRRTAFSLLGLAAAMSVTAPSVMLTTSEVQAQTAGMDRREDRRDNRQDRRSDRRSKKKKPKQQF